MSFDISRDTKSRLTAEAWRRGVSVDALSNRLIHEHEAVTYPARACSGLPVWHLGDVGSLHHRDIYQERQRR